MRPEDWYQVSIRDVKNAAGSAILGRYGGSLIKGRNSYIFLIL
jgi:hypothetical protein